MSAQEPCIHLTTEERRNLREILCSKEDVPSRARLRATTILMSAEGDSAPRISRILGVSDRTVQITRQKWRRQSYEGLYDAERPGRPSRADEEYQSLLIQTAEKDPHEFGYAFTRWTSAKLAEHMKQQTGIAISPGWIQELLRRNQFVWRKGKLTTRNLQDPGGKKEGAAEAEKAATRGIESRCGF